MIAGIWNVSVSCMRDDGADEPIAQIEPDRQRDQQLHQQFTQQHAGNLAAGEAENAQAGQFPCPLLQCDSRVVVYHADCNHHGEQR